jgi:hypothetical protein
MVLNCCQTITTCGLRPVSNHRTAAHNTYRHKAATSPSKNTKPIKAMNRRNTQLNKVATVFSFS